MGESVCEWVNEKQRKVLCRTTNVKRCYVSADYLPTVVNLCRVLVNGRKLKYPD